VIGRCKRALHHAASRSSGPPEVSTASSLRTIYEDHLPVRQRHAACRPLPWWARRACHRTGPGPDPSALPTQHAVGAIPVLIASARTGSLAAGQTLKISYQFPGGTIDEVDFRDRLCQKFAAELEKRTNGAETAQVYPNSSLMKTVAQFSAVRRGVEPAIGQQLSVKLSDATLDISPIPRHTRERSWPQRKHPIRNGIKH
jgi:hypothetical protein